MKKNNISISERDLYLLRNCLEDYKNLLSNPNSSDLNEWRKDKYFKIELLNRKKFLRKITQKISNKTKNEDKYSDYSTCFMGAYDAAKKFKI
jgi:hypothetical protein